MMKPGTEFEPAYKLMAEYRRQEGYCANIGTSYDSEYWRIKLAGMQCALKALTGEWPIALADAESVTVCHGEYEQIFTF